jgi:hypothetical protein
MLRRVATGLRLVGAKATLILASSLAEETSPATRNRIIPIKSQQANRFCNARRLRYGHAEAALIERPVVPPGSTETTILR